MNSATQLQDMASDIAEAARAFQAAAEEPASHAAAPDSLAALEEALQVLSGSWYQLAADAAHRTARREGLSHEQEAQLVGTLHDIAAAFARCARACRIGRSRAAPIIARGMTDTRPGEGDAADDLTWFEGREGRTQRVA